MESKHKTFGSKGMALGCILVGLVFFVLIVAAGGFSKSQYGEDEGIISDSYSSGKSYGNYNSTVSGAGGFKSDRVASPEMNDSIDAGATYEVDEYGNSGAGEVQNNTENSRLDSNRKMIVTLDMSVETLDYDKFCLWVENEVESIGGYIEHSEQYSNTYNDSSSTRYCNYTLRIPDDKLKGFSDTITETSNVVSKSREIEDVTLDYTDTESKIKALKVEQERLLELLAQADNIDSILVIERRMTEVRTELETNESRLRLYDNLISYSTINLDVREVKIYTEEEPEGILDKLKKAMSDGVESVKEMVENAAISIAGGLPVFAYLVIVFAVIVLLVILVVKLVIFLVRRGENKKLKNSSKISKNNKEE